MGKNYRKIYNRLVKEIKKEKRMAISSNKAYPNNPAMQLENNTVIAVCDCFLSMLPEIEGKQCNMVIMNREEFKSWKRKINN